MTGKGDGRTYRRCGCRDHDTGRQLGAQCPQLAADGKHGTWWYAVYIDGKITRRGGHTTEREAKAALRKIGENQRRSVAFDDKETVAEYLAGWVASKRRDLKASTASNYAYNVDALIVPHLGKLRLEKLAHRHVDDFVTTLEDLGKGAPTIRKAYAVLRSALADAVNRKRLPHNPAEHVTPPPPTAAERDIWTAGQAVAFLDHARGASEHAELFEVMACTGLRRGEALALQWQDIDLEGRVMHVRRSVSDVAGRLVVGTPKTRGSAAGVGLTGRAVAALRRQQARQAGQRAKWGEGYQDGGLVFCREDGAMLRPEYALRHFHALGDAAGLPRVRLHDLRHLAATLMLTSGVPLPLVSKTLRHSQLSITADLYGHLTVEAAHAAVDGLGAMLDAAAAERLAAGSAHSETTSRPHLAV